MAEEKDNSEEPSIEEILSSIREIISEDDEDEAKPKEDEAPAEVAEEPASVEEEVKEPEVEAEVKEEDPQAEEDEVLDLASFAEDENATAEEDTPDPLEGIDLNHPDSDDIDMVEMVDEDNDDGLSDILGSDEATNDDIDDIFEEEMPTEPATEEKDALIDKVAEGATVSAMARLAENISLARSDDGVTLEDIVRDLLRPMLKDWLDDNLPDIIERLVAQELERLAQKAVRK